MDRLKMDFDGCYGLFRQPIALPFHRCIFFMLVVSACGGGGSGDINDGFAPAPAPQGATIDVTLADADGDALSEITPLQAGLFRVSVSSPDGNPVGKEVFSGECKKNPP